jgi:hypothetical protein
MATNGSARYARRLLRLTEHYADFNQTVFIDAVDALAKRGGDRRSAKAKTNQVDNINLKERGTGTVWPNPGTLHSRRSSATGRL